MERLIKRNVDNYSRSQLIQLMQTVSYASIRDKEEAWLKFHLKEYIENFLYKKFNYCYSYHMKMICRSGNNFVNAGEIRAKRMDSPIVEQIVLSEYQIN